MQFVHLEATNFKSFENFSVSLEHHGFVKIEGINNTDEFSDSVGSGKSTIGDALSYALTGETVKGNSSMSDVKNIYTKGTCSVTVKFIHKDIEYIITRSEDGLTLIEGGVDISKHLRKETQALIEEKFPYFTPTFLGAAVIIGQNMPNSFTNNKPSARKQVLEDLTNSSFMIEEVKTLITDRRTEWQAEIGNLNTEMVILDTKITSSRTNIVKAEERLSALRSTADIEKEISVAEANLKEGEQLLLSGNEKHSAFQSDLDKLVDSIAVLNRDLDSEREKHSKSVMDSMQGMLSEKTELEKKVSEFSASIRSKNSERDRLLQSIQSLKNAPTHCPTCKQALPDAHEIDTTAQESESESMLAELNELRKQLETVQANLAPLSTKISDFQRDNQSNPTIDGLRKSISESEQEMRTRRSAVDESTMYLRSVQNTVNGLKDDLSKLRLQLSEVDLIRARCKEDIDTANKEIAVATASKQKLGKELESKQARLTVLNSVYSFATRDFRTILLSNIIKRLDRYAKQYCNKVLNTSDIEFKDEGNNIAITFRGRDFGVLSGGEGQIVKMCITLALKRTLEDLVGFRSNLLFLDEILDNTDKATAHQLVELVSGLGIGSLFFISHHEDVYLPIDKTWTVTKTNNISELAIS